MPKPPSVRPSSASSSAPRQEKLPGAFVANEGMSGVYVYIYTLMYITGMVIGIAIGILRGTIMGTIIGIMQGLL